MSPAVRAVISPSPATRAILALTVGRCLACLRPLTRGLVLFGATRCLDCRAADAPVHESLRRAA